MKEPDQLNVERLAGGVAVATAAVGDGTLIEDPAVDAPLVINDRNFNDVTETVCGYAEQPAPLWWWGTFTVSVLFALLAAILIPYLIITGVGVWGLNDQVPWSWAITNFVFWIGIGHAGTLISAILCLLKQKWRTAVNRSAEAMTIFAVICAGIFPAIHVGRIWFIWFVFPIPNSNSIWPNFRSPLLWDVFAVSTYFSVSLMFWYMGMIPDLASLRDRALARVHSGKAMHLRLILPTGRPLDIHWINMDRIRAYVYGLLAIGWRFSGRHWHRYEAAYLILAGVATPLVLSVHSIVSYDFAMAILPGWHSTIFPPYFVAGAIFGGFAMVLLLLVPLRVVLPNFGDLLTLRHVENMAKILLVTGMMVGFAYGIEFFIAWYSGSKYEWEVFINNRANPAKAPYWWAYYLQIFCNVVSPQLFWVRRFRQSPWIVWLVALAVTIGMWFERFVIIVTSLHRAWLPGEWGMFFPTWVDIGTFAGSCGIFLTCFMLFTKFLPMFAMAELKAVMPAADPHGGPKHGHDPAYAVAGGPGGEGGEHPGGSDPEEVF